jgi:phage nucleotide-binding protein
VTIKVQNTLTVRTEGRIKIIVYGQSGVGKTVFASQFPKPVILAPEEGLLSIAGKNIDYISITTPEDIEESYQYLAGPKARAKYQTVVVDSLTSLQTNVYMPAILESQGRMFPEIRDWGQLLENMRRFSRQMVDLPYNIVFICLEEEREIEEGSWVTRPMLTGRFANEAPAYVDIVMRLIVEEKRRKAGEEPERTRLGIFQPARSYVAKDRSGFLPQVMKDPTPAKVLAKVRGVDAPKKSVKTPKKEM